MERRYLTFVFGISLISWLAWILVLFRLDPCLKVGEGQCEEISPLAFSLFFASLFFALTGLLSGAGFLIRRYFQTEFFYDQMTISLRQGFLLSLCVIGNLILLLLGILTWWTGLLLLLTVFLIELYFTARA